LQDIKSPQIGKFKDRLRLIILFKQKMLTRARELLVFCNFYEITLESSDYTLYLDGTAFVWEKTIFIPRSSFRISS
ncbi:MAG: hypothetical protein WCD79_12365, partial [Chthoniobacteraceae bacterium]